ncbi:general transcription factor IIE subunit 1-like [Scyliorhinus canicula]|uniref:general transcription factor IIE subunit 1-like n=1 Tax=Scyliorhinus canicula TaxID=7830 RepID=UPI0018F7BE23|nr:general transcription factor IIE subunit 1-like [Scyliorhinus canicula]XP_038647009.1 general transcription factor IIE subunit 1-like [Scyliorhinus canicula]
MGDQNLLTEVPASLKRLAKYVVRGFYGVEHSLTLDILIRYPCVKEEDLQQLLKFEKKQLRSVLNTLKADKFLKSRIRVETNCEGKSSRHNYYYINYKLLVDVVKYKLDNVRRKIETDERNSSTRSSFKCPLCFSTFTDLEVNHLFDPCTGNFNCTYCHTEVEEDASAIPKRDAQTILATFNEQIEPIYALLHETEDIALSHELLEPQPTEIPELALSHNQKIQNLKNNAHPERWSNKVCSDLYEQNIVVNVQESDVKTKKPLKPIKAQPIWMTTSTVDGAALDIVENAAEPAATETHDQSTNRNSKTSNYEVIKTLMIHEKKTLTGSTVTSSNANRSEADSETSESEDESKNARPQPNLQEEEFEQEKLMVKVAGKLHLFSDLSQNPELVSLMTEEERESYISTCQEMFHLMYD